MIPLRFLLSLCSILLLALGSMLSAEDAPQKALPVPLSTDRNPLRLDVVEAKRHAVLLHRTYLATLTMVHRQYFDEDERHILPARAFEDVFREIDTSTGGQTRWIAVNTPAMNVDHEPKTEFEKQAAKMLSSGHDSFEQVRNRTYTRAAPVPFAASCSKCHQSSLGHRRSGRMAALVISLPVKDPAN